MIEVLVANFPSLLNYRWFFLVRIKIEEGLWRRLCKGEMAQVSLQKRKLICHQLILHGPMNYLCPIIARSLFSVIFAPSFSSLSNWGQSKNQNWKEAKVFGIQTVERGVDVLFSHSLMSMPPIYKSRLGDVDAQSFAIWYPWLPWNLSV